MVDFVVVVVVVVVRPSSDSGASSVKRQASSVKRQVSRGKGKGPVTATLVSFFGFVPTRVLCSFFAGSFSFPLQIR